MIILPKVNNKTIARLRDFLSQWNLIDIGKCNHLRSICTVAITFVFFHDKTSGTHLSSQHITYYQSSFSHIMAEIKYCNRPRTCIWTCPNAAFGKENTCIFLIICIMAYTVLFLSTLRIGRVITKNEKTRMTF